MREAVIVEALRTPIARGKMGKGELSGFHAAQLLGRVQRGLVGPILSRFEARGLKIVGLKIMQVPTALAEEHYAEHKGKAFYAGLIDYITSVGAFPTVCIFRPVIGSDMENVPSPAYEDMVEVMRHMYVACRRNRIPIGVAPNIEVSLIVNPDDAQYLVPRTLGFRLDRLKLAMIKRLAAVKFRRELRPHRVKGTLDPAPRAKSEPVPA